MTAMSAADLIDELVGDPPAPRRQTIARLLTLVEDGEVAARKALARRLGAQSSPAHVIGVTGPPGAGKSTLTSALTAEQRRRGRTVAVLAVDPSSPFSGGSVLGDRLRLEEHFADPEVFIRSMASRGQLGGLSAAAPLALDVFDAAGFATIIVETVGVGQSELDIASIADTTLVVLAPGMGDKIQAIKAGILEVAEVIVVNKGDRPGAGQLESELRSAVVTPDPPGVSARDCWQPPIVRASAVNGEGVVNVADAADRHLAELERRGERPQRRRQRTLFAARALALDRVRAEFDHLLQPEQADVGPDQASQRPSWAGDPDGVTALCLDRAARRAAADSAAGAVTEVAGE